MAAYRFALHSQVDCIEIDVSRSLDGVLLALHDRYSGSQTSHNFPSLTPYLIVVIMHHLNINNDFH